MGSKSNQRFYIDIGSMPQQVTGSCNLGVVKYPDGETRKFVVDCGLFQGRDSSKSAEKLGKEKNGNKHIKEDERNRKIFFNPENIDFLLVTHNHIDHIGRIPFMVNHGFGGPIYLTNPTSKLIGPALRDSMSTLDQLAKITCTKPLYTEADISKTMQQLIPCNYDETVEPIPGMKINFFKNGHLPGAALILVRISYPDQEDINILYTGDYNNKNMFLDVPELPEWVLELPLTIVQESTYGDMESSEIIQNFEKNILENMAIHGTTVAPVFSLGRAQEILYTLKTMQMEGKLDRNIPIYYDGKLSFIYTRLYKQETLGIRKEMENFIPENTTFVDKELRNKILADTGYKIIVTTSGMGSYGPAQVYIPKFLSNPNALIQYTGYTAEGSLGARMKNAKVGDSVSIAGLIVKKKARVEYTTEFSAHAKSDEMLKFLAKFKNLKMVIVNHGETETKRIFAEKVADRIETKNVGILGEDYFFRVGPYGLIKTLGTRFE